MKRFFLILVLCSVRLADSAWGGEFPNLYFNRISINDGLSQRRVSCIVQDTEGFIWFGTDNGLNRWDGTDFRVFRHDPDDSTSLSSSAVNCLTVDSDGNLWIGCDSGVCMYDRNSGNFRRLEVSGNTARAVNGMRITAIHDDGKGSVWLGSYEGLMKYDKKTRSINHYSFIRDSSDMMGNEVRALCPESGNILWIGTFDGLYRFDTETGAMRRFIARKTLPGDSYNNLIDVLYMPQPDSGTLYIGSSNGLAIMNTGTFEMEFYRSEYTGLTDNDIHGLALYDDSTLLIGTGNGLSAMNLTDRTFSNYNTSLLTEFSLPDQTVWNIYRDRYSGIWIGTDNGVAMLDKNRKKIEFERTVVNHGNELQELFVYDIAVAEDGYWLGTKNGIFHYGRNMELLRHYDARTGGLSHDVSKAILKDSRGIIWAGTNDGLYWYDKTGDMFEKVTSEDGTSPLKYVYELDEDNCGNIIANISSGVCIISPETGRDGRIEDAALSVISISGIIDSENNDIVSVKSDADGNIWLGSNNKGVIRYGNDGTTAHYRTGKDDQESICSDKIYCLLPDNEGYLWVGTDSGLCRLDTKSGKAVRHNRYPDLSRAILNILAVDGNRVWVTSADKLIVYNHATMTEEIICDMTRLFGMAFLSENSSCMDSSGRYYLAGNGGFVNFSPDDIIVDRSIRPLVFPDIEFYGDKSDNNTVINNSGLLDKDINTTGVIRLKYYMDSFRIWFSLLDYSSPEDNKYRYKLEGYDKFWQNTDGARNSASYSNLKPGRYSFSVSGCNPDGIWSNTYKTLDIIIDNPWWTTWWAYTLYLVLFISVTFLSWNFVRIRLKLQNALKLEKLERQKTEELNGIRTRLFENISHELKTPLSLIIGPVDELAQNCSDRKGSRQIGIIRKNCDKLLRLINQIMDMHKYDNNAMALELKIGEYISFVYQIYQYFHEEASARHIDYLFEYDSGTDLHIYFDADKIEKALFNLISNAFKYTPDGGTISVSVNIRESGGRKYVETSVSDTGNGIPEDETGLIFDRFHKGADSMYGNIQGTGIGLSLTRECAEQHQGSVSVKSREGKGSTFCLSIPCDLRPATENDKEAGNGAEDMEESYSDGTCPEGKKITIMTVDDNEDLLSFLKISLEDTYAIIQAHNGNEAVTSMKTYVPDIIISDIMMPGMDGFELCRQIKADIATCHIAVILLTARNSEQDREKGYACGADGFLSKPFSVNTLKTRIATILSQREKLQERYRHLLMVSDSRIEIESEDDKFIASMVEIIEKNIKDPDFGIQELCAESRYSYQQIYRKIKALTGKTVNDFVRSVRLSHAAAHLRQSGARISEIMYDVGFNSHSYFTKCFREAYGLPPREYAEKFRNKSECTDV